MGIPGAGKSRVAGEYVERGYVRLNRDERGGTLRALVVPLEEALASPEPRVVLDNTYLTRDSRSYVLDAAARHGAPVRCVWLDTPLAQAQVNLTARLLDRFGQLPGPADLRALAKREQGVLAPTSQMRAVRELEPPSVDEGFVAVERLEFTRATHREGREGVFVAASAVRESGWTAAGDAPHLVFDWLPDGSADALAAEVERVVAHVTGAVEAAVVPASRRAADVLVPAAAARTDPRLRAGTRPRLVAVDSRRHKLRPSHAGDDARRALRGSLTSRHEAAVAATSGMRTRRRWEVSKSISSLVI